MNASTCGTSCSNSYNNCLTHDHAIKTPDHAIKTPDLALKTPDCALMTVVLKSTTTASVVLQMAE